MEGSCDPPSQGSSPPVVSLQVEPSLVEPRRVELGAELVERAERVAAEDVLDDADPRVVPERHVDVLERDEVHRDGAALRAAHSYSERAAARREQEE